MFQIQHITAKPISAIPSGDEVFVPSPGRLCSVSQYLSQRNPWLPKGVTRSRQISRILQPHLIATVEQYLPQKFLPLHRFGMTQIIPLDRDLMIKWGLPYLRILVSKYLSRCINDIIKGDHDTNNLLELRVVGSPCASIGVYMFRIYHRII